MKTTSLCVRILLVTLLVEPDDVELKTGLLILVVVRATCVKVESGRFLGFAGPMSAGCFFGAVYVNSRYIQVSNVFIYICTE